MHQIIALVSLTAASLLYGNNKVPGDYLGCYIEKTPPLSETGHSWCKEVYGPKEKVTVVEETLSEVEMREIKLKPVTCEEAIKEHLKQSTLYADLGGCTFEKEAATITVPEPVKYWLLAHEYVVVNKKHVNPSEKKKWLEEVRIQRAGSKKFCTSIRKAWVEPSPGA